MTVINNGCRLITLSLGLLLFCSAFADAQSISGTISTPHGPLKDATVKVQGTELSAKTDESGTFTLTDLQSSSPVTISAWKKGYYAGMRENLSPPASDIRIELVRYQLHDNSKYSWIPPTGDHPKACDKCHNKAMMEMTLQDPHMNSAKNPRFLTIYNGTDTLGNRSPDRSYRKGNGNWANQHVPNPYGSSETFYGPGFRTDFPHSSGNCSGCHLPGASSKHDVTPESVTGADKAGIHCDFCHKVADVKLDPHTRMPYPGMPGVHAMKLLRPFLDKGEKHEQLFFGPFDDPNAATGNSKLPLISKSEFCAPCHLGRFWDKVVYNSYGEWLESPYGKKGSPHFKTCQNCHMSSPVVWRGETITNTAPGKGGIDRAPSKFNSHRMTIDETILKNALSMKASARNENGKILVDIELVNDKTGHHVPSDSPLRQMILHVEAQDADGRILKHVSGPTLPSWCGTSGNLNVTAFAGKPGKAFAKLLKEKWTGEFPTASYWNDFEVVSDNRLAALARDASSFSFEAPADSRVKVKVTLYYRRAFYQMMEWKKWSDPDLIMAQQELMVSK